MTQVSGDIAAIAAGLSDLERELLLGTSKHWGSWMMMVAADLRSKGLARKLTAEIGYAFDTPLGLAVRAYLEGKSHD